MADILQKQPWEERFWTFNFENDMDEDATLASVDSITVALASGGGVANVTVSNEAVSGKIASAKFVGGTDGQQYTVRCRVIDSDGQKLELDGRFKIKEL
jgi:hypothetical protein